MYCSNGCSLLQFNKKKRSSFSRPPQQNKNDCKACRHCTQTSTGYPTDSLCTPHDPLSKIWSFLRFHLADPRPNHSGFDTSIINTSHGSQADRHRNPFQTSDQTLKWSRTDRSRTARSVVSHFVPKEPFRQVLCDCSSILWLSTLRRCGVGFARFVLHWRRYRNW